MKTKKLYSVLKKYTTGWVLVDKNNRFRGHSNKFSEIQALADKQKDVFIVPAAKKYFGFIT